MIQIPSLHKKGYRYKFYVNVKDDGIKKILMLMLPVMVSTWVQPINLAINTNFASTLYEGSGVSAVNYANTIYSIIVGVFVLSIANVIFPRLSRMSIDNDKESFGKTISATLEAMAFLIIPMTLGLMVLSSPVISVIYERGKFDGFAVEITSKALFYFSLGMPGFGIQNILSRAFYAKQKGKMPLISGIISIGINIVLCVLLVGKMDVGGLALASALSQTAAALILIIPMQKENKIISKSLIKEIIKMTIAALIMAAAAIFIRNYVYSLLGKGYIINIIAAAFSAAGGMAVYGICALIFKINSMKLTLNMALKIIKRGGNS